MARQMTHQLLKLSEQVFVPTQQRPRSRKRLSGEKHLQSQETSNIEQMNDRLFKIVERGLGGGVMPRGSRRGSKMGQVWGGRAGGHSTQMNVENDHQNLNGGRSSRGEMHGSRLRPDLKDTSKYNLNETISDFLDGNLPDRENKGKKSEFKNLRNLIRQHTVMSPRKEERGLLAEGPEEPTIKPLNVA